MTPNFEWLTPTARPAQPERTRAGWEAELAARAALLAKLGYPKQKSEERLKQLLAWEYESVGKSAVAKKVGAIVAEAYRRAGTAEAANGGAASRPARRKSQ